MMDAVISYLSSLNCFSLSKTGSSLISKKTGGRLTAAKFNLIDYVDYPELTEVCGGEDVREFFSTQARDDILRRLTQKLEEKRMNAKQQTSDFSKVELSPEFPYPLSECKILINVMDIHKTSLYVKSLDSVFPVNWNWLQPHLIRKLGKDGFQEFIQENSLNVKLEYDPSEKRFFHNKEGMPCWNTYSPPSWAKEFDPTIKRKKPKKFIEFMKHLFPKQDARQHVYQWLSAMTFYRAKPILILCGVPGIGKNILIETIGAALVGQQNYRCSTRRFEAKFHAGVSNSMLYFLDEVVLEGSIKEDLKQYHNGFAVLERKGKDAEQQEKISASFVVANNYVSSIKLHEGDRKFTVPDMTDAKLLDLWSEGEIEEFCRSLDDDEVVRDIAALLWSVGANRHFQDIYQKDLFKTICNASRPEWFQNVIHLCETQEVVNNRDIRNLNDNRRVSFTKLSDKVKEYQRDSGVLLGELEAGDRGTYKLISKVYKENKTNVNLDDENEEQEELYL